MPAIFNFLYNNPKFLNLEEEKLKYCVDVHGENRNINDSNLYNKTKHFIRFSG